MSKTGHLITATALAYAVYERSASPTLALSVMLGASFPDVGEFVQFRGEWRSSLIPHRTLTHWIPLYVAVLLWMHSAPLGPWWLQNLISGICLGSILHVALDMFSPAGIPLWNPFGHRVSLGFHRHSGKPCLYKTGSVLEIPVIAVTVFAFVCLLTPSPPPFSFQNLIEQSIRAFSHL